METTNLPSSVPEAPPWPSSQEEQATAACSLTDTADPVAPDGRESADPSWPDLGLIDGGEGQLNAARDTLAALGINNVPLVGIAKGPDRDAGRETFHRPGQPPFRLP